MISTHYNTIEEMEKSFQGGFDLAHSRKEFEGFLAEMQERTDIISRGSGEARFKLYNSAQLFWNRQELFNFEVEYFQYIYQILENIKSVKRNVVPRYFDTMGTPANFFSYLSFARHHGAPVPILDFTRDIKIATYFAASSSGPVSVNGGIGNYFAIYSMTSKPQEVFLSPFEAVKVPLNGLGASLQDEKKDEILSVMLQENPFLLIEQDDPKVIPYLVNSSLRIVNQEGLFLSNNSPHKPLEEYIPEVMHNLYKGQSSTHDWINVILVHKSLREFVLDLLAKQGINDEYVYPNPDKIVEEAKNQFLIEQL